MKTVFDYNISAEESERIGMLDKEIYLDICTEDDANRDLATLFYLRDEMDRAREYADKLPIDMRNDFWRIVTHP